MAVQHPIVKCRRYWRRYVIACLSFLSIISIEVILIYLLADRQVDAEREAARKLAVVQGELLQRQLDRSFSAPFTLALIVRHQQGMVNNFDALAADLINSYGGIRRLKLAPKGIVREMYPRGENAPGIDRHLFTDSSNSSPGLTAIASRTIQVTKPLKLFPENPENMMGIVGYLPVFLNQDTDAEEFWGFAIVEISIADLLQESKFNQLVQQGYDYQLEWFDPAKGDRWVFARSQKADLVDPITHPVKVAYGNWILGISPKNGWGYKKQIFFETGFIFFIGLLVAYLVCKLLEQPEILQQQVELRVADLSKINQQLIAEITERKRIEQALRESEERFRAIADATPIPLVISRCSDGLVLYGNQPLCQTFGLPPEKLIGCQTPDYYCDRNDRTRLVENLTKYQQINNYEVLVKKEDGTPFWVAVYMRLIVFNCAPSIFAAFYDITERKQAESQISQALAREKELNQLKSYFISMTSHQFRTPLTTILGSAELLKSYSKLWTHTKKEIYFERIENTVKHMIELLDEILLIAHAESGKLRFLPSGLNLPKFCHNLVQRFQLNHETDPQILLTIQGDYSPLKEQPILDRKLLEQILTNLLANAIKYSGLGSKIYFLVNCDPQKIIFTIKDQGIGIPSEDLTQLFEPFHRCKNVKKIAGTGLGLTIVKKAADLHGAEITVDSQVGVGTTFTVTIPLPIASELHTTLVD